MENTSLTSFMETIKKNKVVMATVPMGYVAGLPIVQIKKKRVCLTVPFFKFIKAGEADKSLIFPIKYTVTALWPGGKIIGLEDLEYNPRFISVDFTKPLGIFRHESIRQWNAGQYREKKAELYSLYEKLIGFLQDGTEYSAQDQTNFKALLNIILEPSLVPIYKVLDDKFAVKFINEDL